MPDQPLVLSIVPPQPPAAVDYDAICATMMESARGRWFLDEFARRNRNADTTLVLAAIERVETAIRGEHDRQSHQDFRAHLLDMAQAITATRAEVAEIRPPAQDAARPVPPPDNVEASTASPQALAAAERIADVAWTMRERGFDLKTCDQIEALAKSILAVPFLRNTDDQRTLQLSEVLMFLERRVNAMLEACGSAPAFAESWAPSEPGTAGLDQAPTESVAADPAAPDISVLASPPTEGEPAPLSAAPAEDVAAIDDSLFEEEHGSAGPEPPRRAAVGAAEPAEPLPALVAASEAAAEKAPDTTSAEVATASIKPPPPVPSVPEPTAIEAPTAEADTADFLLEPMPLPVSSTLPAAPAPVEAVSEARAAEAPSPDPAASASPPMITVPALPAEDANIAPVAAAAAQPATRPIPRPATGDPLAALKAMSPEERIALFT
jgi:hypothetical protein